MASDSWAIQPGHALGFMTLGAALQDILTTIAADKDLFTSIDVHFSQSDPLTAPVVITLPHNGLRLRFDGADQRLRLIEVTDLKKSTLVYKGMELVRSQEITSSAAGPAFKRVYQMFGASYPGEYMAPSAGKSEGTYVLSWPGIAFNFPLQHSAWSPEKDHVSLLGSQAAGPAAHMAIFEGKTWSDTRKELFVREPTGPRSTTLAARPRDNLPAEIESASVEPGKRVTFERRHPAPPFTIVLNKTTPQDLVTELGAPDATFKPTIKDTAPAQTTHKRTGSTTRPRSGSRLHPGSQPSSYSSTNTDSFETDFDSEDADEDPAERANRAAYWCYFSHGMDILVGPPGDNEPSRMSNGTNPDLVVKRVVVQGNVPGSAAFNRHRRLRWTLELPPSRPSADQLLHSESHFESELKPVLLQTYTSAARDPQTAMGRVINRCWDDPMDSGFFLPDQDRDEADDGGARGSEAWLGNVRLFQFPGVMFEVLQNGAVAGLYVTT
ncbi:hypothetical protein WHR41_08713 [Cladosporium halotolerans]|uniref:Uncharacterized protein n=1 Tax=Cladosporium halotolerans TaxID=1052096 RepID=A0AB34KFK6_9PEZI